MNVSLYQAASALNASSRWQDVIGRNMAGISVAGFRKQDLSFAAVQDKVMSAQGPNATGPQSPVTPKAVELTSFQQGESQLTGVPTHIAIEGSAFFEIQMPDGSTAYTRNGQFQLNAQGTLVTKQGYPVLSDAGPIQMDINNPGQLSVAPTGEISQGTDQKGKLKLTEFQDPQRLTRVGGSYFLGGDPAAQPRAATESTVRQGWMESSNVIPMVEMVNLIAAMRTFEANQRIIQTQDDRMSKAIQGLTNP